MGGGSGAGSKTLSGLVLQILPLLTRLVTHAEDLVPFTVAWYRADRAAPASCELEKMGTMAGVPLSQKEASSHGSSWEKPPTESALCRAPVVPLTMGGREAHPAPAMLHSRIYPTLYLRGTEMLHALKAPFPPVKRDEDPSGASALCV